MPAPASGAGLEGIAPMSAHIVSAGPAGRGRREPTLRSLPPEQQYLVRLFQHIRYGRIHRLLVRGGRPELSAGVTWTRTVKVHGDNAPHPGSQADDFALRREVVEFFRMLEVLCDAEVTDIQIRDGFPFTFELSESFTP
jgi:hypothetical protein